MSLRARLTLLYTTLLGGILLLFGVTVYLFVGILLTNQVDDNLVQTFEDIRTNTRLESVGKIEVLRLPSLDLTGNVYAQAWDRSGQLHNSNVPELKQPFDPISMQSSTPLFSEVDLEGLHLRVLSVPLVVGERPIGTLQMASNLRMVDATLNTLVTVLVVGSLIAMGMTALVVWLSTRRALAPLEAVTQTALQISRADDLSRRILYQGPPGDEVGQLITAFNQTLARLENLFNTQRRFLADVGHELRTPLTVIKGNAELMRRMGCSDEESLEGIENEVDRLTRMVGDLLLLAQAESGKLPLDRRVVELDTLVLEALQQMRVLAGERLSLKLGEIDQIQVCGDQDRLKQVLVNLIGNAIQYTPPGGEVIVGLEKSDSQAKLTVRDNGPGIPVEDLPHVFERFYRGEKARTRSRDGKGYGLGLSIAYWIVRNHEGRIEVDSKQGKGTTFCVWLPLAQKDCAG
ncbi:MAG TPA: HAMP domain-containing sensor histidine kinase [Anaerolineales bacterium]|nr:HAMP domain-containing sensor histidine kinase [Anaerolineales bacterium]